MLLDPARPAVALIARPLGDPARACRWSASCVAAPPGEIAVYVSEAMVDLYGAARRARASTLPLPERHARGRLLVRGVWRDYARQCGAIIARRGATTSA